MVNDKERDYLRQWRERADEDVSFFSDDRGGKRRAERERSYCAAFLRCLGVPFAIAELKSVTSEPTDVIFRDARFQLCDGFANPDRRPGDEVKAWRHSYHQARASFVSSEQLRQTSVLT